MSDNWAAVAEAVQRRRELIGVSAAQVAFDAEISPTTMSKIETGAGATPKVLAKVSRVLQWPDDALLRIAQGGPAPTGPPPVAHRSTADRVTALEDELAQLRVVLGRIEAHLGIDRGGS